MSYEELHIFPSNKNSAYNNVKFHLEEIKTKQICTIPVLHHLDEKVTFFLVVNKYNPLCPICVFLKIYNTNMVKIEIELCPRPISFGIIHFLITEVPLQLYSV